MISKIKEIAAKTIPEERDVISIKRYFHIHGWGKARVGGTFSILGSRGGCWEKNSFHCEVNVK